MNNASVIDSPAQRNKDLARIHIMVSKLGWSEEEYRDYLFELAQVKSAADLGHAKRQHVIGSMNYLIGRTYRNFGQGVDTMPTAATPLQGKVKSLWQALHAAGKVRNASDGALNAYVRRITKVDALRWTRDDQATVLIESLKKWLARP